MTRRVHRLEHVAAPVELDAIRRGLEHAAAQDIAHAHEPRHLLGGRRRQELRLRRRVHDPPLVVDHDAIGELKRLRQIVGDEHGGLAPLAQDGRELPAELPAKRRVQGGERLVEEQEPGVHRERPAEGHALLLAPRQFARAPRTQAAQPEPLEHLARAAAALLAGPAAQSVSHIVLDGQMREEGVALEDIAQSAPLGRHVDPGIAVEEHLAADDDAPAVRPDEPGEALKGQGLAGPGGAEERHDLVARRASRPRGRTRAVA